ncbi:GNAT family N-acetyltransferase [Blastococcus sp. TF02-09]|uniref:GNAT family N-acetyltransferase n=1 Tax=Blastococcus sp. TF02-09 TaxID=2250576 RepID=UPI000DE81CF1|nr:GNAT family N-acetyltransferase [Blastococcus sp. TF02-9]RBY79990.1 GNAT family N-acetyltransferase [Blastococcus sp. TF02-9]
MDRRRTTRALDEQDRLLLRLATWFNVNWNGPRFSIAQVDGDPHLAAYYRTSPEFGAVSTAGGEPTGVVWVTRFPADAPGYGFVRADVPELSVCVLLGYRGEGLGLELVEAAVREARDRGLPALSLSVEEGNPARRLYERLGFRPVDAAAGTLLLELRDVGHRPPA